MPSANTPSPIMVRDPITAPGLIMPFAPTTAQSPKTTPSFDEICELEANTRSASTAPSIAPGPTTLPHPITLFLMNAPAQTLTLFMTMLWMIEQLWPITHFDPIKEPD